MKQALRLGAVLVVIVSAVLIHQEIAGVRRFGDERHHLRQIMLFCEGKLEVYERLTTIPGYHAVVAGVGRLIGGCTLPLARNLNTVFGALSLAFFFVAARKLGVERGVARTLHFYFLPILLPYHFLAYTDSLSLLLILTSLLALLHGRTRTAGWIGCASLLVRQNNVAWLAFICLYVLLEDGIRREWRARLGGYVKRVWPCLAGIAGFLVFVWMNQGAVVLKERGAHRLGLHTDNVFFALGALALVFLPSALSRLFQQRRRLAEWPILAVLALGYPAFLWTFRGDHPYNQFDGFLRNDLLGIVAASPGLKHALYVPIAIGLATLLVTKLRRRQYYAIYPLALALLVPARLIETRYYIVPFVLLMLFRDDEPQAVESVAPIYSALLSAGVLYGITTGRFGL